MLQRPELPQALAEFLGIKGFFTLDAWATIMPTVNMADLVNSPYLRYAVPVARAATVAAVVGESSHLVARPGPQVVLQINQVIVENRSAAVQTIAVAYFTAASIASLTISATVKFGDMGGRQADVSLRGSEVVSGSRAGLVGTYTGAGITVPANDSKIITFPGPGFCFFGNDTSGRGGLAIHNTTVNAALSASFIGNEWPLPG